MMEIFMSLKPEGLLSLILVGPQFQKSYQGRYSRPYAVNGDALPEPSSYLETPQIQQDIAYEWVCQHSSKCHIRDLKENHTKAMNIEKQIY